MEAFAVFVEEGVFAVFNEGALDLFGGAPALGNLHAIGNAAHVHLGNGRALAGVEVLRGENSVKLAIDFENVALADRRGDYLDHKSSL